MISYLKRKLGIESQCEMIKRTGRGISEGFKIGYNRKMDKETVKRVEETKEKLKHY